MEERRDRLNLLQPEASVMPGSPRDSSKPPLRRDQRRFRAILASVLVAVLAGVAVLPLGSPVFALGLQICAFKGMTGLPCPLCGITRATQALLHGDLAHAVYLNVAALPALMALVAGAIVLALEAIAGRAIVEWNAALRRLRPLLPALAVLFLLYWIVHLVVAVRASKPELVDLRNPVARSLCQRFSDTRK